VSIAGSGFTGVTQVTFNGTAGTGLSVNSAGTVITVTTPRGAAGAANVVLHWGDGRTLSASLFTFLAQAASASPVASPSTAGPSSTPATADGQLPNTGSNNAAIAWLAVTLVAVGALLTRLGRRPGRLT
jgi:LPXTG-motif cell wall-anchored protein